MRTLLIDNYDSFTYNLHHLIAEVNGTAPVVIRNDDLDAWERLDLSSFDNVVISPGPGRPERAADFGLSARAVELDVPLLGVCLGHQGLCHLYGGRVGHAPEPFHGRVSDVEHDGKALFAGIPSPFRAVRYHSLAVTELPDGLDAIAETMDGVLMAVRHRTRPQWGVQFHPESIAGEYGRRILANFRDLTLAARSGGRQPEPAAGQSAAPAVSEPQTVPYELHVAELDRVPDAEQAFRTLFGNAPHHFWLDSSLVVEGLSRYSFMGSGGPLSEYVTYEVGTDRVRVEDRDGVHWSAGTVFDYLDRELRRRRLAAVPELGTEFNLGYVGYLGYELKADCGGDAAHTSPHPDAALLFCDRMLVLDHLMGTARLLSLGTAGTREEALSWLSEAEAALTRPPTGQAEPTASTRPPDVSLTPRHSLEDYRKLIDRCQEVIRDGESYEVCLTNTFSAEGCIDTLATYRKLRQTCPAPFAALLGFPEVSVLSASPERFLAIDAAGRVESKPIKGTRRRGRDATEDARLAEDLRTAEKDRSENLMIVDLLRNDLGRVCDIGSVHVPKLFDVETYATVHQLVSTVRGRLAPARTAVDAVRAAFPGGSMTGAPKVRTMAIIDALEGGSRGVYSGALGYFALSGAVDLNIAIRTLVHDRERTTLGTGGAIIALSDPPAEVEEILLKAARPSAALVPQTFPNVRTRDVFHS
ncbi:aminodeoxychorismate synthase component I [Streptomyces sp. NPDC006658]|uniref:aminodeoxychorismate synthase component I n=1 Tax=Streptomyces sp. NPDC006658 TaxID=3156900 RepID=UPI0033D5D3B6